MMKRRSAGPFIGTGGGMLHKRAISKDMIGLPTNFVHEGHVGVDQVRNRGEVSSFLIGSILVSVRITMKD